MVRRGAVRSLVLRSLSVAYSALGLETRYVRVLLFGRDITTPPPPIRADVPLELSELRDDQIDAYCRERRDVTEVEVRRRLAAGYRCLVSRSGVRIVGEMWLATGKVWLPKPERWIRLEPKDVYVYYASLIPELRGRNVGTARSRLLGERLRHEGYRRVLYSVSPHNRPARGLPAKLGAERLGTIGYVRIGPLERDFARIRGRRFEWTRHESHSAKPLRLPAP
jgi:ribosomal protein S18 acetylase RimI-like enzyme